MIVRNDGGTAFSAQIGFLAQIGLVDNVSHSALVCNGRSGGGAVWRPISGLAWGGLLAAVVALSLPGCSDSQDSDGRLAVSGGVLCGDEPLHEGSISFIPVKGSNGPVAATTVSGGAYKFTTKNGPIAGSYDVRITRVLKKTAAEGQPRKDAPAAAAADGEKPQPPGGWTFNATVEDDQSDSIDFEIE